LNQTADGPVRIGGTNVDGRLVLTYVDPPMPAYDLVLENLIGVNAGYRVEASLTIARDLGMPVQPAGTGSAQLPAIGQTSSGPPSGLGTPSGSALPADPRLANLSAASPAGHSHGIATIAAWILLVALG